MLVKHLTLTDFRNYQQADIALNPGVTLFVGRNGQGKTNLVEAVRYLATLNSHRVAGYLPLIRQDQTSAIVRALASHAGRDALIEVELNRSSANRARINKANPTKTRDILGYINCVVFAPEDLDIIKKDPSNRRAFIDELVVQVSPRFAGVYSDYERVLKQRNTLLRTARQTGSRATALSTLDAWDAQLVGYGTEIIVARMQLIERLRPLLTQAYQAIAETNNEPRILVRSSLFASAASATFESSDDESDLGLLETSDREAIQEAFKTKLSEIRPRELERGITLIGPHRDDLLLMLGTLPAKGYASHGECWSFALGLRLASIDLLRNETQSGDPILILDDVFAELDSGRRARLAQLVANNEQVLITAAVAEDVPDTLFATTFHVKHGTVAADEPVVNDD